LGPANTRYKRSLDALLKQRSGRRNFVRSSLSEFDSEFESELSEIFWEAVSAAAIPQEVLEAPLAESLPPQVEVDDEVDDTSNESQKNMSCGGRSTTWDDCLATVD
jgi:hypothetical protein